MNVTDIAHIAHEANRALCASHGDYSQPTWDDAPEWQIESALDGVRYHLAHPSSPAWASHANWMQQKEADGWRYGPVKDAEAKTHPCMVPFEKLPASQQAKDHLFTAIVNALAPFADADQGDGSRA